MPNGTYGGVRGRKTKVGRKLLRFPPTRLWGYRDTYLLSVRFERHDLVHVWREIKRVACRVVVNTNSYAHVNVLLAFAGVFYSLFEHFVF